jgi:hypothetical protein
MEETKLGADLDLDFDMRAVLLLSLVSLVLQLCDICNNR